MGPCGSGKTLLTLLHLFPLLCTKINNFHSHSPFCKLINQMSLPRPDNTSSVSPRHLASTPELPGSDGWTTYRHIMQEMRINFHFVTQSASSILSFLANRDSSWGSPVGHSVQHQDHSWAIARKVASTTASHCPTTFQHTQWRPANLASERHHRCWLGGGCRCQTTPLSLALLPLLLRCFGWHFSLYVLPPSAVPPLFSYSTLVPSFHHTPKLVRPV